jgi:uncharacterized phage protein gp47/JayE
MNLRTTELSVQDEIVKKVSEATDDFGLPLFKNYRYSLLSKIRSMLESSGRAIYLFIDRELVSIQRAIHPHTADEPDLHEWLRRYGLSWKEATKAKHTIRLGSKDPVFYDVPISQGMIVTTDGPDYAKVKFKTLNAYTLPADIAVDIVDYGDGIYRYTIAVQVECMTDGPRGNVAVGAIKLIESPPQGIDFVYNHIADPDQAGLARETPAQVRERLNTAEGATIAMWTPDWYRKKAEVHPNVARAIFKSSKELGIPGTVKLFVLARSGALTEPEKQAIIDDLDSDTNNPGGVARVLLEDFTQVPVNKTVFVQFPDLISIPDQGTLDDVWDRYFAAIGEAEDFSDAAIKALYLGLPRVVRVIVDPPGEVVIGAGEVAVPGNNWAVVGEVYDG